MKEITSLQHPLVKHLARLRKDRQHRHASGTVVIEGNKLVREVCARIEAVNLLVAHPGLIDPSIRVRKSYCVAEGVIGKIAGSKSPEGTIAEVPLPAPDKLKDVRFLLALDGVSDPGNLGTLIRTALALDWDGIFYLSGCCDPFNDKALRSAKGATFRLPYAAGGWKELDRIAEANGLRRVAADIEGEEVMSVSPGGKILLVLGSESQGLSEETVQHCEKVTIPISKEAESLNVSVAGGILMHALSRGRGRAR